MTSTLPNVLPSLGYAAPPRFHPAIWPLTTHSDDEGRLCIGEVPLTDVANEFDTPAYVIDETDFRSRARRYRGALRDTEVIYAGKSLLTIAVARWVREEGLGLDVCSAGELATALAGGVEKARIIMHGNAKSQDELRAAVRFGVGRIVVDSPFEIARLAGLAEDRQRVLIRVTPNGCDIHGHNTVNAGTSDQKFGFALDGGHTADAVARVLSHRNLDLVGLHCHLGSQVTLSPAAHGGRARPSHQCTGRCDAVRGAGCQSAAQRTDLRRGRRWNERQPAGFLVRREIHRRARESTFGRTASSLHGGGTALRSR